MAYVKIIFQNSPSTATPMNAQNLNHMDNQIALNDQRLTEIETSYVKSFKGRKGEVVPENGDYNIGQISPLTGAQVGQVPVVTNIGTEEAPELVFRMGAGGGGGGHTIVDSDGQDMPQEDAMQFLDAFVSDDDVNGRTVVENIKEHTTASDYENATEDGIHVIDDGNDVPIGASSEDKVEVTADGVKTYSQVLDELFALIDVDKLTANAYLEIGEYFIPVVYKSSNLIRAIGCMLADTGNTFINGYYITASGSGLYSWTLKTTGNTVVNNSSTVAPNGTVITLYYGTSSTVINLKTDANYCMMPDGTTNVAQAISKLTVSTRQVTFTTNSVGAFEISSDATEFCLGLMFSVGDEYTYYQYNNRSFILFDMAGNKKLNTTVTARAIITHI